MRTIFFASLAALALLTFPIAASAADMTLSRPAPIPAYVPPPFSWTGFYIGGNFGGAWASTTLTDNLTGASLTGSHTGWLGGGQMGFNYQIGNFVLGAEGTLDWTSLSTTSASIASPFGPLQVTANTLWAATLAARLGFAVDRWLVYGKAGGGWANNSISVANLTSGVSLNSSNTNSGWLLGAGVEFAFTQNWSAKLEYDYLGLRAWTAASPVLADTVNVKRQINMFMTGANYRFGW